VTAKTGPRIAIAIVSKINIAARRTHGMERMEMETGTHLCVTETTGFAASLLPSAVHVTLGTIHWLSVEQTTHFAATKMMSAAQVTLGTIHWLSVEQTTPTAATLPTSAAQVTHGTIQSLLEAQTTKSAVTQTMSVAQDNFMQTTRCGVNVIHALTVAQETHGKLTKTA